MDNLNQIWDVVREQLFVEMIEVHYNTWILPLIPLKKKGNTVYIYTTNNFTVKIVNSKYRNSIESKLSNLYGENINLVILDVKDEMYNKIKYEDVSKDEIETDRNSFELTKPHEEVKSSADRKISENFAFLSTLNKKHTFENFVRGKSNDLALAIAINVAENPGTLYNPFYIYGNSGLGKTHLMQAIGHRILEKSPDKKVIYISSENFMNEFIATITDNKNSVVNSQKFRDKYRNCDVLMIDDIQFISGKESTQEEIFHTFNSLQQAKKQIIFTSDKRPEEIKGLEDRLVTRLNGGMIADIQEPDFETRVAILNHKINMEKYSIPNSVVSFIAENITSNIRNLEGAILKVMAYYNLEKQTTRVDISEERFLEIAKLALSINEKKAKPITLELIKEVVAEYYELTPNDLIKPNRQKSISDPRQIAMHLSRELTDLSLVKIANSFERDHATVIYGYDKVKQLKETDPKIKKEVEEIIAKIKSR